MSRERDEAIFAEVVSLTHELNKAISAAERVQIANSNAKNIERMLGEWHGIETNTQQLKADTQAALRRAGWLSATSLAMLFMAVFTVSAVTAGFIGIHFAYKESSELFAKQREAKIARFSSEQEFAARLFNKLRELDVEIYSDALIWSEDSKASDFIRWGTIDDPEKEGTRIKIVQVTDTN